MKISWTEEQGRVPGHSWKKVRGFHEIFLWNIAPYKWYIGNLNLGAILIAIYKGRWFSPFYSLKLVLRSSFGTGIISLATNHNCLEEAPSWVAETGCLDDGYLHSPQHFIPQEELESQSRTGSAFS